VERVSGRVFLGAAFGGEQAHLTFCSLRLDQLSYRRERGRDYPSR
jgi:hypothetical protein